MNLYDQAIQRVCKWRSVFVGWQLGTRSKEDPEAQAVKDHREVTILLRIECSALANVLITKGIVTQEEFTRIVAEEAEHLNLAYEKRFPGITAHDYGIEMKMPEAGETMKNWRA